MEKKSFSPIQICSLPMKIMVSGDYKLSKNLILPMENAQQEQSYAIHIEAPDVNLNLNGHTLDTSWGHYGIVITGNDVTITNGVIKDATVAILGSNKVVTVNNIVITKPKNPHHHTIEEEVRVHKGSHLNDVTMVHYQ